MLSSILESYRYVRQVSVRLCAPLLPEDMSVQSMPETSPTKWHLAHTTWFFETFVLQPALKGYNPFCPEYAYLFNSYYNTLGPQHPKSCRGKLSRPSVQHVVEYRQYVDQVMEEFFLSPEGSSQKFLSMIELGLNHEQQHQELILMDVKHLFSLNPLNIAYTDRVEPASQGAPSLCWINYPSGARDVGYAGNNFAYDNERPRHKVWLQPFQLASRCVTNLEYLEFMNDGGYQRHELWLSDGWDRILSENWSAPLYWFKQDEQWWFYTLGGQKRVEPHEPVVHLSYFEADAYARWCGARLPTEAEWEVAASSISVTGHFLEDQYFHPIALNTDESAGTPLQMFGDVWEWTQSAYTSYPGYRPPEKALGEYNAKFMCNQWVLRGGSCVTPRGHIRPSYRNFSHPHDRWQFSGVRLAKDA